MHAGSWRTRSWSPETLSRPSAWTRRQTRRRSDVGVLAERLEALAPVLGEEHLHPVRLEDARQGEDVPDVVVDDQDLAACEDRLRAVQLLEHPPLAGREPRLDAVQEERRLVEEPLGRGRVLDDDRLRVAAQARLLAPRQLLAGVDDDRQLAEALVALYPLEQLESGRVREAQVEHHAVEAALLERRERLLARADRRHVDVVA